MDDWNRIRRHFSEAEKDTLNNAITGEVICPRGCVIDETKAVEVTKKVTRLLGIEADKDWARKQPHNAQ
jgi:hypothetical protein